MEPDWLRWDTQDDYDVGRYEPLRGIAAEILATHSIGKLDGTRRLLELEMGPAPPKVDVWGFFEHHRRPDPPADFDQHLSWSAQRRRQVTGMEHQQNS